MNRKQRIFTLTLDRMINGGQAIGTHESGRKVLVWGGLPGEKVIARETKRRSSYSEAIVEDVVSPSAERTEARDESYLSTSPWQIMSFAAEQTYKSQLIQDAFRHHSIGIDTPNMVSDGELYGYRNKVEFSWYGHEVNGVEKLDLAFFRRGGRGKIPVNSMSLARPEIMRLALTIRDLLRQKPITARNLKTLLIRCDQSGSCAWQLYVKDPLPELITKSEASHLPAAGGEIIYSDPKSPASKITKRLARFGAIVLQDTIKGVPFRYATEGFFQVNLPMYEQTLGDIAEFVDPTRPLVDMYAGVGTIGLTVAQGELTLVEVNEHAVREMRRNIDALGRTNTTALLAASESATSAITSDVQVVLDPPRAGLHQQVIDRLLEVLPPRIIYLSCNPVTQARDAALLSSSYHITMNRGYNYFPRTPHIEHLVVLDRDH